jgi:hypothetical protein
LEDVERRHSGRTLGQQSREIGAQWRREPDGIKQKYHDQAQLAKEKHETLYPGYKYQPKRNAKRRGKTTTPIGGKKKVEEELPIELEKVESPPAKCEVKDAELLKPQFDSGIFQNN